MADLKATQLVTPRIDVPIGTVDAAGNVYFNANFLRTFFNAIIARVGGQSAPSITDLATAVTTDEMNIVALQAQSAAIAATQADQQQQILALALRVTAVEASIADTIGSSDALESSLAQARAILHRIASDVGDLQSGPRP